MLIAGGGNMPNIDEVVSKVATATPTLTSIYNGLVEPVKQGLAWWWWWVLVVLVVLAVGYLVMQWWTNR